MSQEKKEKPEELISLTTKKSVFQNTETKSIPPTEEFVEEDFVEETNNQTTQVESVSPIVLHESCYYIITYLVNGEEETVYTQNQPVINNNLATLHNPFKRHTFSEIVLKRKKIESYCFKSLDTDEIIVNLDEGVLIKTIQEQKWFSKTYEEAKQTHDERVLACYRSLVSDPSVEQVKQTPKQVSKQNNQKDQENWETLGAKNNSSPKSIKNTGAGNNTPVKDRLPGLERAFEQL